MLDIHCHLLPGIDDGAGSMEEALVMARQALKDGIRTIVATPHCFDGVYDCQELDIAEHCRKFNDVLLQESIALRVLPGAEVRFTPELMGSIGACGRLTLGQSGEYLLLELPDRFLPEAVLTSIEALRHAGLTAVLAHPERNGMLHANPGLVDRFVAAGARLQLTAESLLGDSGRDAKKMALWLIRNQHGCLLASDGHGAGKRKVLLARAVRACARELGKENAARMVGLELYHSYARPSAAPDCVQ